MRADELQKTLKLIERIDKLRNSVIADKIAGLMEDNKYVEDTDEGRYLYDAWYRGLDNGLKAADVKTTELDVAKLIAAIEEPTE